MANLPRQVQHEQDVNQQGCLTANDGWPVTGTKRFILRAELLAQSPSVLACTAETSTQHIAVQERVFEQHSPCLRCTLFRASA